MSFKDKPLKKINADTRVTIDVLHQNISESLNDIDESLKYYLDNGLLLSEYYETKELQEPEVNQGKTILDIMKKKSKGPVQNKSKDLIDNYMANIDDNVIISNPVKELNKCQYCNSNMVMEKIDSVLLCEKCGNTETIIINSEKNSYKDPPRESSYFAYKRINHFNEWLAQFQAKETTDIPEEVYKGILSELNKDPFLNRENISHKNVREILKRLKFNKYYEHIPHIINVLNGKKAPLLSRKYEEQLRIMFKEIQKPFLEHCPVNRKNFLSYSYVLHKFCELLELDHLLEHFPLLKSREKLQQQDRIWEKMCNTLQWQYIPSI